MGDEFDLIQYLRMVPMNMRAMIALIAALIVTAPAKAAGALLRALTTLKATGTSLEAALRAKEFAEPAPNARPYDIVLDRSWGAMIQRLQCWSSLPEGTYPEQAQAERLLAILAADGLAVLKLPYEQQWAALKVRLDEVHAQGLDDDLAALAGPRFVEDVRLRFEDYGRVLGLTQAREAAAEVNLSELLRGAQQRVTEYVVQVVATIDPDDPATAAAARAALRPLLDARDTALAARKSPEAKPDAPQPDAKPDAPQPVAKPADPVVARPSKPAPARPSAPPPA